ncbi:hypothetical protein J2S74_002091 [Evansella vedderi]|uniref:Uncharacterized protein n=1 Tax=Evansella vedderi TaxID=38282 RepID=A0ABT9ZVE7_9BACI|nr:hypothetical protein [Evansella vedderi]MDQ0254712.1 hypothetical protein [Evansella vedderi]
MEVTFRRELTSGEREQIRQFVGYYRGIASFKGDCIMEVKPKEAFSEAELLATLKSLDIPIDNVDVLS